MRTSFLLSIMLFANLDAADWHEELARPNPAFSQVPLWFWNDDLNDDEIKRQMADFREHGVYGFVIHPRMGLPKTIPYMGQRWLHYVRVAVEEAARTGMHVVLYDESMYPSGSAHGEVVRSNAAFAAQGLMKIEQDVAGPKDVQLAEPKEGVIVATVLAQRIEGNGLDFSSFQLVGATSNTIEIPEGSWRLMTFVQVESGGRIRGVYAGEEDDEPDAPRAADLLNPEAVKAFIHFGYEPYAPALGEHLGKTVVGMFTDEPNMLGRRPRQGLVPWTTGLADYFRQHRGYDLLPLLPALFDEQDQRGRQVREDFELTLTQKLDEVYYAQLSDWCMDHHIALTGHPSASDDILVLHRFQVPGQDMVWRWLLPNNDTGLEGVNSTVAKCASSVARHDQRRFAGIEIYGAYGWHLTMEELKWLADWMMVRGINRFVPHAFYYSIRDERVQERPPDLGMHNTWWPHYRLFADYTSHVCGLLTDSRQVCDVAILSVNNHLPWRAAKRLLQHQIDFNYLEDRRLCAQAKIENKTIIAGNMNYKTLIVDRDAPLPEKVAAKMKEFENAGGKVVHWTDDFAMESFDLVAKPQAEDLRCLHVRKYGVDFYLLTNEGENHIETTVHCGSVGRAEWFDPWTGRFTPAAVTIATDDRMILPLALNRRESRVLCVDPSGKPKVASTTQPTVEPPVTLIDPWIVRDEHGRQVGDLLDDWRQSPATSDFVGTLRYETTFTLTAKRGRLDLGQVGDWAVVHLNGKDLGPRFWAPYEWDISNAVREGTNELVIEVTNSLANRYDPKNARPSGLFGPVVLK